MSDLDRIQAAWANQPKETFTMSIEEIRTRSIKLQSTVQSRNLLEYAVGAVLIVALGIAAFVVPTPLAKLACVLNVAGVAYVMWQMHVMARAASRNEMAVTQNWSQFYREELVRQRDALAGIWRWYLGPLVPGMVVFWLSVGMKASASDPVWPWVTATVGLAIGGIIFVGIASLNKRAAAGLQAEIDLLDQANR